MGVLQALNLTGLSSNLSPRSKYIAPVAQLVEVLALEARGFRFESE
jgi:hypothetical protein